MALTKIDDRGLKTPIDLLDNEKIRFGTGNDLEIFHSGNHSQIVHNGTGNVYLDSIGASVNLRSGDNAGGVHNSVICNMNAGVELYYDNSKKLNTRSDGVDITGILNMSSHIYLGDSDYLICGASNDLMIYHDGTTNIIEGGNNNLSIRPKTGENGILISPDGAVNLYYDDVKKFETTSTGVTVTGNVNLAADNNSFTVGAGSDLQIYHDGTNNILRNVGTRLDVIVNSSETAAVFNPNGSVDLYCDNSKKFETTSTGAILTSGAANTTSVRFGNTANRGLEIKTYQSAGNNDSGVVFNAADSENSGYSATLEFDLGGVEFGRFDGNYDIFKLASACNGITFNGDWAAANRLNDYEEGTFNPGLVGSTSAGTLSYSAIEGHYTKIGNTVRIDIYINQSSHDGTGDIRITGMPFPCKTGAQVVGAVMLDHVDFDSNFRTIACHTWGGSSQIALYGTKDDATWGAIGMSGNTGSEPRYIISMTYPT